MANTIGFFKPPIANEIYSGVILLDSNKCCVLIVKDTTYKWKFPSMPKRVDHTLIESFQHTSDKKIGVRIIPGNIIANIYSSEIIEPEFDDVLQRLESNIKIGVFEHPSTSEQIKITTVYGVTVSKKNIALDLCDDLIAAQWVPLEEAHYMVSENDKKIIENILRNR